MRELEVVNQLCTPTRLVVALREGPDREQFSLAITDELRHLLTDTSPTAPSSEHQSRTPDTGGGATKGASPQLDAADDTGSTTRSATISATELPVSTANSEVSLPTTESDNGTPDAAEGSKVSAVSGTASDSTVRREGTTDDGDAAEVTPDISSDEAASSAPRTIDPRLSAPLPLKPRIIQERIRAGATVAEVATDCDLPESRIHPFAYPVLLERSQIADLAKTAHPNRPEGLSPLTLAEIVATALSARAVSPATAQWDAWLSHARQWIVTVTWPGMNIQAPQWSMTKKGATIATLVAVNAVAAEFTNPPAPELGSGLSDINDTAFDDGSVTAGEGTATGSGRVVANDRADDLEVSRRRRAHALSSADSHSDNNDHHSDSRGRPAPGTVYALGENGEVYGQDVLIPGPDKPQPKRKRKRAETPHWEDVLLGVRASTKRPRK